MTRQVRIPRRSGRISVDNLIIELEDMPDVIVAYGILRGNAAADSLEFYSPGAEEQEAAGTLALTDDMVELLSIKNANGVNKTVTNITDPTDFWAGRRLIVRVRTDVAVAATVTLSHEAGGNGEIRLGDAFASATDAATHTHDMTGDHQHDTTGDHQHDTTGDHQHNAIGDHDHVASATLADGHQHTADGDHLHTADGDHLHTADGDHQHDAQGAHDHQPPSVPVSITVPVNQVWQFEFMALDLGAAVDPTGTPNGWELVAAPVRVV